MFLLLIHQQKMGYTPYRKAKKTCDIEVLYGVSWDIMGYHGK